MRAFTRILYWLAYSVILSFMPVLIGYLSARIFQYEFNRVDALADLLITDFCLSATVLRDTVEKHEHFIARSIIFLMVTVCFISASFFGHIMMLDGLGQPVNEKAVQDLSILVMILLALTTLSGILTQVFAHDSR